MNKLLVSFVLLVGSVSVSAACNTNSFAGKWKIFATTFGEEATSWQRCTLKMDSKGAIDPASSFCVSNSDESEVEVNGQVNVSKTCTFDGEMVIGEETLQIVDGQMTGNKKVASGVGFISAEVEDPEAEGEVISSFAGIFTFNGIKRVRPIKRKKK